MVALHWILHYHIVLWLWKIHYISEAMQGLDDPFGDAGVHRQGLTSLLKADGVVAAVVPKLELEGGAPKGLPQQLVAHADAKHRLLPNDLPHILHRIWHCARVALQQDTTFSEHTLISHEGGLQQILLSQVMPCCKLHCAWQNTGSSMPGGLLSRPC